MKTSVIKDHSINANIKNKLNIKSFTIGELAAKLLIIQGDYVRQDILIQGREKFDQWVLDVVRNKFTYDVSVEKHLCMNLSLFLLGNSDNSFSKLLNKN